MFDEPTSGLDYRHMIEVSRNLQFFAHEKNAEAENDITRKSLGEIHL